MATAKKSGRGGAREGAGRPFEGLEIVVKARLNPRLHRMLMDEAEEREVPASEIIRAALEAYLTEPDDED
jgi:hypothetical protein